MVKKIVLRAIGLSLYVLIYGFFFIIKTRNYNLYINICIISNFYNSLNNGKLQSWKVDTQ